MSMYECEHNLSLGERHTQSLGIAGHHSLLFDANAEPVSAF